MRKWRPRVVEPKLEARKYEVGEPGGVEHILLHA